MIGQPPHSRRSRSGWGCLLLLSGMLASTPAKALEWPDVAERIERDLQAADASTRRQAAHELGALGPGRGAPLALQALGDPDAEVRLAAADAAIRLGASGATDEVTAWLNNPDVRQRRKACEVARAMPSLRAIAPLARSLGDPDAEVRAAAAEALGHQGSADAVAPLLGRLDDPVPQARIEIVTSLARLGDSRAVVPLVGKVQDSSPEVRGAVARALGDLADPRASPALVLSLRDQSNDVRRDALDALGRIRATDAVDAIAPFATDRTASLRLAALHALGQIASTDALRFLVQALGGGDDAGGSLGPSPAREALVASGAAAIPPLHALLTGSPTPASATSAAWVLGALRATGEGPTLVAAMRRGTLPPAAAMHALVGAGTSNEVPVVLEFIADPSPAVRDEALAAAMALLDPRHPDGRAVEPLAAALRGERPSAGQRARMATLLGRTGAARAAPLLVHLARARDSTLRLAALDALGILGPTDSEAVDNALLDGLAAPEAEVRLHAAIALAEGGGRHARDELLVRLDGGSEIDRPATLTALGGLLARAPTDAAIARLSAALVLAAGPERDAILDALGRIRSPAAIKALTCAATSREPADRREVASLLAAHGGDREALATLRVLAGDHDVDVSAQAAWSLGTIGDASDEPLLLALSQASHPDVAGNAAAALGRIAARIGGPSLAARALCPLAAAVRSGATPNALAGLALAGARCGDGAGERRALTDDPAEDVRAAAARLVIVAPTAEDTKALERCVRSDPSGAVAERCRSKDEPTGRTHALLAYVVADGIAMPRPGASYAMLLADGLIHRGTTDRRGAVFDPVVPEGEVTLRPPQAP